MSKHLAKHMVSTFTDHVVVNPTTACHLWTGAVSKGYGRLKVKGKGAKAYRVAYELAKGPIPAGAHVLHDCANTLCVNPDHLRLGTHAENMQDRQRITPNPFGERAAHAKLTQAEVDEIRARVGQGALQREVAAIFGTSQSNVSDIVRGKSWPLEVSC